MTDEDLAHCVKVSEESLKKNIDDVEFVLNDDYEGF